MVALVAPVAGTPTRTIEFRDNGVLLGTAPLVNGVATITVKFKQGAHPLSATYAGSAKFNGSSGTRSHPANEFQSATIQMAVAGNRPRDSTEFSPSLGDILDTA